MKRQGAAGAGASAAAAGGPGGDASGKRPRLDSRRGPPVPHSPWSALFKALQSALATDATEVEIRLGRVVGRGVGPAAGQQFSAGIEPREFEWVQHWLRCSPRFTCEKSDTTDLIFKEDGVMNCSKRVQCTMERDGLVARRADIKRRLFTTELHSQGNSYDLRVSGSSETDLPVDSPQPPDGWMALRRKFRLTFKPSELSRADLYQIDVTRVERDNGDGSRIVVSHEVEIELAGSAMKRKGDEQVLLEVARELWILISTLHCSFVDPHFIDDIGLVQVDRVPDDVKNHVLGVFPNSKAFPGSMPVNLRRAHIRAIQSRPLEFMVSEKTDGLRFMLLVNPLGTFLINRNFRANSNDGCFKVEYPLLSEIFGKSCMLFDGELVRNLRTMQINFLIFDALVVDGVSVVKEVFRRRLEFVRDQVQKYRDAVMLKQIRERELPFVIIGKSFVGVNEIKHLLNEQLHDSQFGIVFEDYPKSDRAKRFHRSDGIIITPCGPYSPFTEQPQLLKWKFPGCWTVDFRIDLDDKSRNGVNLFTTDGSAVYIFRQAVLSDQDFCRLCLDYQNSPIKGQNKPFIGEVKFDVDNGQWGYIGHRADKDRPNHIFVAVDTLEVIVEGISKQELAYRLCRPPDKDRWTDEVRAHMDKLSH